ncbi:hypothetical protein [Methanofollis fontis]|uniref:Uncharacterized protein n=1 Tax=Methanofollis fontis TaxID=2052832 RepID=A0A483CTW3_9EURY|nr:hypothetical protein [Methanofollis fontis]TAJ44714.1 hypothetical protein CUJ86_05290 [Methanofollis fontis]
MEKPEYEEVVCHHCDGAGCMYCDRKGKVLVRKPAQICCTCDGTGCIYCGYTGWAGLKGKYEE